MRVRGFVLALLAVAAADTGCVSLKRSPSARFFVLRPLAEPPASPAAGDGRGFVGVMPARLPGHLDRPQLVTSTAPGELRIDEFLRWAEPLDAGFTRTLAENLAALLPEHFVARAPWRSEVVPRCRVVTDLRVFGPEAGGEVRLEGRWALLPARGEKPLARGTASLRRGPLPSGASGVEATAQVEAMSELVAELGRDIAAAVRALPDDAKDTRPEP